MGVSALCSDFESFNREAPAGQQQQPQGLVHFCNAEEAGGPHGCCHSTHSDAVRAASSKHNTSWPVPRDDSDGTAANLAGAAATSALKPAVNPPCAWGHTWRCASRLPWWLLLLPWPHLHHPGPAQRSSRHVQHVSAAHPKTCLRQGKIPNRGKVHLPLLMPTHGCYCCCKLRAASCHCCCCCQLP